MYLIKKCARFQPDRDSNFRNGFELPQAFFVDFEYSKWSSSLNVSLSEITMTRVSSYWYNEDICTLNCYYITLWPFYIYIYIIYAHHVNYI